MIPTSQKTRATILVVDDDEDIVQTIKGNLELDGYEVLTAFDGRSGVDMVRKHRPDLIILDLNLPDIDGIKACQIIRREFDFPIIMLTARDGVSDTVLGLECGADDYMVKPFNFLELSARIKAILKRVERDLVKNYCEIRDLSMDFKTRNVSVRGEEIRLTRTEFELLELFAAYPDEVLSREFITNQIWRDSELYQHSRALDVHVQRLRKKIEADAESPRYIVTVAGVGYKFQTV
ncbi:MAG: response regulator transcription factor [Deltaproteobacteria bacterium]|nr:response regulator transcription factor [Deltaproteobacteria bacterium]MBW2046995.1 response regulator transcription factor [Deltaproteobacteria bacterium]MBW2111120.1 response regulator transcription factor [Deltaproteobacteria bacterium]MBW2351695.1 response regulator transcription factor [Deltaproteobacteria bacterium]HDZ90588.1 response regulator transcription factor [Deltaproteobacteria bacterium]